MAAEAKRPLLERVGVQYFERRSSKTPRLEPVDAIHFLNPQERAGLWRVQKGAVSRAALAGALSATASGLAEIAVEGQGLVLTWAVMGGVTLVASIIEILFLYWDTLRSVHELAHVAGLELSGPQQRSEDRAVTEALARAALELPNPINTQHHIDPRREASKAMLLLASFAYKAKVGVTNFLFKMLVRRMLGRVLVRSTLNTVLPFVAVPITAAWNAVVAGLVLKEARLRVMGPSAARELVDVIFTDAPPLSVAGRLAATRAIAAAIVRTQDLHPNLLALLELVRERAGDTGNEELDDVGQFLQTLKTLSPAELKVAVQLVAVACIVDGKVTRREQRLYSDTLVAAGRPVDFSALERLKRSFVSGEGLADDAVRAL